MTRAHMTTNKYIEIAKQKIMVAVNCHYFDHRSVTILLACEVEELLTAILEKYFSAMHDARQDKDVVSLEQMKKMLLDNNRGIIGGIYKSNKMAMYLDLISYALSEDIGKLVTLRNAYAHKKSSGQLSKDAGLFKLLTDTTFYKQHSAQLADCDEQGVFRAFEQYLIDQLQAAEKNASQQHKPTGSESIETKTNV